MSFIRKNKNLLFACLATLALIVAHYIIFSKDYSGHVKKLEEQFQQKQADLDDFLKEQNSRFSKNSLNAFWQNEKNDFPFYVHIFKNDSLVFWSTNQVPISRFADIHFPAEGILHLQNGWYYSKYVKNGNHIICATFLIKHEYEYENKELNNSFSKAFEVPFDANISLDEENEYNVYNAKGGYLFSILPQDVQKIGDVNALIYTLLFIIALTSFLFYFYMLGKSLPSFYGWIIPLVVLTLRAISLQFEWTAQLEGLPIIESQLYSFGFGFPNFLDLIINSVFILYLTFISRHFLQNLKRFSLDKFVGWALIPLTMVFWSLIVMVFESMIIEANIPLSLDQLFSLNSFSFFALIVIGCFLYAFYTWVVTVISYLRNIGYKRNNLLLWSIGFGLGYFLFNFYINEDWMLHFAMPAITFVLLILAPQSIERKNAIGNGLFYVLFFSLITNIILTDFINEKDGLEKKKLAQLLATEQDLQLEKELAAHYDKISQDKSLQRFLISPKNMGQSEFENGVENRIFKAFADRYEMGFHLFDTTGASLILGDDNQKNMFRYLNLVIENHGKPNKLDSTIYFIADNTGQLSYIIKHPLEVKDSTLNYKGYLFATFKSKKLPEEIGFPRLLIPEKAQVFQSLEKYSIATYHNKRLIKDYGNYDYPLIDNDVLKWSVNEQNIAYKGGFSHYIYKAKNGDIILLSSPELGWKEFITSFAYLFCLYCFLLIPIVIQFNKKLFQRKTLTLALKIQLVFVGIVTFSLFAFGWGSGLFVSQQYGSYKDVLIKEKLASVVTEVRSKLGTEKALSIESNGNLIEFILQKFSKVFVTDINLYDPNGILLGSSRAKVFNIGLLSEQMNPDAFHSMKFRDKSEFVHDERIGNLSYASAYQPLFNENKKHLGYVNLQHFAQQNDFENQIQLFLVAIINVFILLLAVSIILSIIISRWVTAPLRLIQESFSNLKLGTENQPIEYDREDEIGALVKNYNQKLKELESAALQLAQNERESAWREMAKQVAHEIKNPLTPMKLSIQHLQRVYDPNNPSSAEMLKKVADSMVEQIDALTKIANEFSNFAKMPKQQIVKLDLIKLIETVLEVFKQDTRMDFDFQHAIHEAEVFADKDQLIRVFNNLLNNAVQAIPEGQKGIININLTEKQNTSYNISISDNGCGITQDKVQNIFVPYFTTKNNGTGLGLAMVKQIVEGLNGTISFESKENEGTTFTIELPKIASDIN
jgi:two-component system nitrogen regulation sensor histidine kinase NtrY